MAMNDVTINMDTVSDIAILDSNLYYVVLE